MRATIISVKVQDGVIVEAHGCPPNMAVEVRDYDLTAPHRDLSRDVESGRIAFDEDGTPYVRAFKPASPSVRA